jgi:hypothetical protein
MRYALFIAAILASSALALELHPGGALVPEETRAVEEAREWHEAAQEAAREADILSREEEDEAELEEIDGDERQGNGCIQSDCRARMCSGHSWCRNSPYCRGFPG